MAFKRILSVTLAFATLVSLLIISGVSVSAAEYTDKNGHVFAYATYDDNGKTKVAIGDWLDKKVDSLKIPSKINGYPVAMILEEAFEGGSFKKVTLPDSLEYVGKKAFWGCPLTEVKIPKNLQYFEPNSFGATDTTLTSYNVHKDNKYMKSIDGVVYTKDGKVLIEYPDGKKSDNFKIPEGVECIFDYAFEFADKVKTVTFPDSMVQINEKAFYLCGIKSVNFTDNIQYVGEYAFAYCSKLSEVSADENAYPYFEANVFFSTPWGNKGSEYIDHLLYKMKNSAKKEIREGTTAICYGALENNLGGVTIKIPASMEIIPIEEFYNITALGGFDVHKDNKYFESIDGMLYIKNSKTLLVVPTVTSTTLKLPDSTKEIFTNAFGRRCSKLQDLTVPEGVDAIYDEAFANTEIRKITFLGNAHYCGENIFGKNENLIVLDLPEGATMLGADDLKGTNWYLTRGNGFVKEENVLLGYKGAFNISSLVIPENITSIGKKAFLGKNNIEELTLPENLAAVGNYAFANCPKLKEVYIPATVDEIGVGAFGFNITFDKETGAVASFENVEGFVIKGYTNSLAESYADANGFEFISVGYMEPESTLLGDIDCDGKLTVRDATALQKYVAGMVGLNTQDKINADFNEDGKINVRDATAIQKRIAKIS